MSGRPQQADPDPCWNCGKPDQALGVGPLTTCSECEVTWMPAPTTRADPISAASRRAIRVAKRPRMQAPLARPAGLVDNASHDEERGVGRPGPGPTVRALP